MRNKYFPFFFLFVLLLGCYHIPPKGSELYNKKEYYITMRDGVRLFTAVYTPKDTSEEHPILMNRTPYSIAPYGEDTIPNLLGPSRSFMDEKYILVYQDVRGKFMSEGKYENMRPYNPDKKDSTDIDEASDVYDSIDWLIKNVKHNNGKAGIWGISYPGFYSAMGCLSNHPSLKAVSPQAPIADWFLGDDFHHNGAFFLADYFHFFCSFGIEKSQPEKEWPASYRPQNVTDGYKFYLGLGPIKNINTYYFRDRIPYWNTFSSHPNYDDYWKSRNTLQYFKNISPAVLVTGGWFDAEDLYGTLNTYKYMKENSPKGNIYLAMGPWFHGGWERSKGDSLGQVDFGSRTSDYYQEKILLPFFNYYLKGKGTPPAITCNVFETGSNQWKELNTWPPGNLKDKALYIKGQNALSFSEPTVSDSFYEYISDPFNPVPYTAATTFRRTREYMNEDQRFLSNRKDLLSFSTGVIDSDLTVSGPITADIFVSTTGTDQDFIVKVIDVFPEDAGNMSNYQMLLRWEVMKGKYRKSYENPEPFKPGEVSQINFTLQDVLHTFKKGHRIMVMIQSSMFPLINRNPGTFTDIYTCNESAFIKTNNRVYCTKKYPSKIVLKISQN